MAPNRGPRFVHEFELAPTPAQARELDIRLRLGRQLYNACIREGNRRLDHCHADSRWLHAKLMPKGEGRSAVFDEICREYGLTEAQLVQYVIPFSARRSSPVPQPYEGSRVPLRTKHFYEHLDGKVCHGLATRAYKAVVAVLYQKGHGRARTRHNDEDISLPSTSIHWRGDTVEWNSPLVRLQIPVSLDAEDCDGVQAHALAHEPLKDGRRVLRRVIRGVPRWYVQFTYAGSPLWKSSKHLVGTATVGIDIGPSKFAVVWDGGGCLDTFCAGLVHDYARIRRLQRYMDRSKRATNPECYAADGTVKRGARFHYSRHYQGARARYCELWRTYKARRKNDLARLAHRLIATGATIYAEDLSYKAWQKHWGKSVGRGAPGMFMAMLERKATQVGGALVTFSPYKTKFSQLCHGCGTYTKKPLSLRVHHCAVCGLGPVDREVYSAFLARHVSADGQDLEISCREAWARDFNLLQIISGHSEPSQNGALRESPTRAGVGGRSGSVDVVTTSTYDTRVPEGSGNEGKGTDHSFQVFSFSESSASIEASIDLPGDARALQLQQQSQGPLQHGMRKAPREPTTGRSSHSGEQLVLFSGVAPSGG